MSIPKIMKQILHDMYDKFSSQMEFNLIVNYVGIDIRFVMI